MYVDSRIISVYITLRISVLLICELPYLFSITEFRSPDLEQTHEIRSSWGEPTVLYSLSPSLFCTQELINIDWVKKVSMVILLAKQSACRSLNRVRARYSSTQTVNPFCYAEASVPTLRLQASNQCIPDTVAAIVYSLDLRSSYGCPGYCILHRFILAN